MRVQIPAYTDRWMMGDRYGEVVKVTKKSQPYTNHYRGPDGRMVAEDRLTPPVEIAHVKLDKSGKMARVILADCTEV